MSVASERYDRVAVIGDIHGASHLLRALIEQVGDRHLISAGDVNDRGPDTRGVVDLLVQHGATGVTGNHEQWLRQWVRGEGFDRFALSRAMGGVATLESYGVDPGGHLDDAHFAVPLVHKRWLLERPVLLDLEVAGQPWWVVHAGLPMHLSLRGVPPDQVLPRLARNAPEELLWPKGDPALMPALDRPLIMGHVPLQEPFDGGHVVAVDTGAATFRTGGRLSALLLPERRFVSVG